MKFLDTAKVYARSGNGGAGCVSFRREAHVEYGGPDGGDGGSGGDVIVEVVDGLNTLIDFRYQQHFKAKTGGHGMGKNRSGAAGVGITLKVPVGTQIFDDESDLLIADLTQVGETLILLEGGSGGRGNARFKSATNRAPRRADTGREGQECWIRLHLKLIADVGLVGLPNAGKSTFLSTVSRANPKIADYPFTTLNPVLGVVGIDETELVFADIPGLIEGAHQGAGLGDRFLGHVERCGALLHLVDCTHDSVAHAWKIIRNEINAYGAELAAKPEILVLNKVDVMPNERIIEKKKELEAESGKKIHTISGVAGTGINNTLRALRKLITAENKAKADSIVERETVPWSP